MHLKFSHFMSVKLLKNNLNLFLNSDLYNENITSVGFNLYLAVNLKGTHLKTRTEFIPQK